MYEAELQVLSSKGGKNVYIKYKTGGKTRFSYTNDTLDKDETLTHDNRVHILVLYLDETLNVVL